MGKALLVIVAFIYLSGLKAQDWFPLGASWYYNQPILFVGESYRYFEVTGDTMIQGKNCKVISGSCSCGIPGVGGYLYQEGDKVYVFHSEADSFKLLYDFTLVAGDTLIIQGNPLIAGDGYFLIDSVTTIQAGSQTLRVQHITHLSFELVLGDKIIERIGSNGCLYPQVGVCDPLTGGLRCYEDDETGLINFQIPPRPCNYITSAIDDPSAAIAMKLYPNPSSNVVHIQSDKPVEQLILFNNLGMPVLKISQDIKTEFDIDISLFPAGIYLIKVVLSDHQIGHRTLIIQK